MRGGWGSASLVKEKGRVNEESEGGGKKRRLGKMKRRRKGIASKQL